MGKWAQGLRVSPTGCGPQWVRCQQQGRKLENQAVRVPAWALEVLTGRAVTNRDHLVRQVQLVAVASADRSVAR